MKPSGKVLLQMGGKGNAAELVEMLETLTGESRWEKYFQGFSFPYGFYSPEEYKDWLKTAGFRIIRVELIAKDMTHDGRAGLASWVRTTWLPYTQRVPESLREDLIGKLVNRYVTEYPPDVDGAIHVPMKRLEVEAEK